MLKKFVLPLWILGGIALLLYSFTQVDLSLTLSQASIFQEIQKAFQYIGWYMRPFSTYLYLGIIIYLFVLFIYTLGLSIRKQISTRELKVIIIAVAVILLPSYNAFSYDLFNYIFDARIISFYHLNPYEYKPMDFPNDPMLSFMRSIHRVYPYGPSWLLITAPLTFLANEIFLLSLAVFKTLSVLSYLGTIWLIYKIAVILNLKNVNRAIVLFALNPLVLIEALVSSHNEIVMMFLVTIGIYFFLRDKRAISILSMIFSIGVKYSTLVFLPIVFIRLVFKNISNQRIVDIMVFLVDKPGDWLPCQCIPGDAQKL